MRVFVGGASGAIGAPLVTQLVARGHGLLLDYAEEAGIPLERTGALLVAWTREQLERFPAIEDDARRNG